LQRLPPAGLLLPELLHQGSSQAQTGLQDGSGRNGLIAEYASHGLGRALLLVLNSVVGLYDGLDLAVGRQATVLGNAHVAAAQSFELHRLRLSLDQAVVDAAAVQSPGDFLSKEGQWGRAPGRVPDLNGGVGRNRVGSTDCAAHVDPVAERLVQNAQQLPPGDVIQGLDDVAHCARCHDQRRLRFDPQRQLVPACIAAGGICRGGPRFRFGLGRHWWGGWVLDEPIPPGVRIRLDGHFAAPQAPPALAAQALDPSDSGNEERVGGIVLLRGGACWQRQLAIGGLQGRSLADRLFEAQVVCLGAPG